MLYREEFAILSQVSAPSPESDSTRLGITLRSIEVFSAAREVLPGALSYRCNAHACRFDGSTERYDAEVFRPGDGSLLMPDCDVESNYRYHCLLMQPAEREPRGLILLLHGLNEKRWDKYLPWALRLVRRTGKSVLLFPIAFHMSRTPIPWSDARRMAKVSAERRSAFPAVTASSFSNAAISSRLHMLPQRFFWSGLQAYEDILFLLREMRSGRLAGLPAETRVDLFAYSIGAFLSEILLMADEDGLFSSSRLFLFCGGPTLDRMNPTSRYILDSEATIALYSFFNQRLENEFLRDPRLAHYFGDGHPAGRYFRSMLSYHTQRAERERRLGELSGRISALALLRDSVIPPSEVLNTLQGSFRDIPTKVDVLDFGFPYSHITPFPPTVANDKAIDEAFTRVMDIAAGHLGRD